MKIASNPVFANFEKNMNNRRQKKNSKKTVLIDTGIAAGTTAIGAVAGNSSYKSSKTKLENFMQKIIEKAKNIEETQIQEPPKLKKIRNKLEDKFAFLIDLEKQGKKVKIPNGLMLVGQDSAINNKIINSVGQNTKCKFIKMSHPENGDSYKTLYDLENHLDKAEEHFQKTGERTLIHVDGFDGLITPGVTPDDNIAGFKREMQQTSECYHSTIIFSTKDPKKLEEAATSGHRVTPIEVNVTSDDFKKIGEALIEKDNKLKPLENEAKKIYEEINNLSKSGKIWKGTAIGVVVGAIIIGIKELLVNKKKKVKNDKSIKSYG